MKSLFPSFFTHNEETIVQDSEVTVQEREELNILDADQIHNLMETSTRTQAYGSTRLYQEHKPKEMLTFLLLNQLRRGMDM